jgi:hypothetical protein
MPSKLRGQEGQEMSHWEAISFEFFDKARIVPMRYST